MGSLFDEVRSRVTALDAACMYGLEFDRSGRRARCIWHSPDRHPSLSFKGGYCHCFSCGGGGSSIDLTAKLFGLSPLDAARKLNEDFRLGIDVDGPKAPCGPSVYDVRQMLLDWRRERLAALQRVMEMATADLARFPAEDASWDDPHFLQALRALSAVQDKAAQFEAADMVTLIGLHKEERHDKRGTHGA